MFGIDDALLVGAVSGLASMGGQWLTNMNIQSREDNAIQRRMADMQKAGLNPVLAAGNPASAQAIHSPDVGGVLSSALQTKMMKQNIAATQADVDKRQADARVARVNADIAEETKPYKSDQIREQSILATQARMIRANQIRPAEFENLLAQYKEKYAEEFADLEIQAKRQGLNAQQFANKQRDLVAQMLEKDLKWYEYNKVVSGVGALTGGFARSASGAATIGGMMGE